MLLDEDSFMSVGHEEIKWFQYTNGVPTYTKLKEIEAVNTVKKWINWFYVQVPKEVQLWYNCHMARQPFGCQRLNSKSI